LNFTINSGLGAIAFDQFFGFPNQCPFSGVCDFENGMCDWIIKNNTENNFYKFRLVEARSVQYELAEFDHTTESEFGHFIQTYNGIL
jgi:hypothetical protein